MVEENTETNPHWWQVALHEIKLFFKSRKDKKPNSFPLSHEACDAFWKYWEENGETHKHGYYESTWGAINAYMKKAETTKDQRA